MRKILAGTIGGAAVVAAIFGAGTAHADNEYVGMTYEKALESISGWGGTATIASRVGDAMPTAQCLVARSRSGNFLDSSGNGGGGEVLLHLNCNDPKTGYSVMTPQGKKAQQTRQTAESINENYAQATAAGEKSWCEENASQCAEFCQQSELCSTEVTELLGF